MRAANPDLKTHAGGVALLVAVFLLHCCPLIGQVLPVEEDAALTAEHAGAIILSDSSDFTITSYDEAEYVVRQTIKILNEEGKRYTEVTVHETSFKKLEEIVGKVYDQNGKVLNTFTKKDMQKTCGFEGYSVYTDICFYSFNLSAGNYPFVIEYQYKMKLSSLLYWRDWEIQYDCPVEASTYRLTVPTDFRFSTWKIGEVPDEAVSENGKTKSYQWHMRNVPAFQEEDEMPPPVLYRTSLKFAPATFKLDSYAFDGANWKTLSRDYYTMASESFGVGKEQTAFLSGLSDKKPDSLTECDRLHSALSNKMRYVLVSIGIGGWMPHTSMETFSRSYGDCKDLSALYVSMLRQLGERAYPALLLTADEGLTYQAFPQMNFNHMILFTVRGNDTTWLDPTCFDCRAGDLPERDENIYVLAVDSIAGGLVRTPPSTASDNQIERKARIAVNTDLSASVDMELNARGNPGHFYRSAAQQLGNSDFAELLQSSRGCLRGKLLIDQCESNPSSDGLSESRIIIQGKAVSYVRQVNQKLYVDLSILPLFNRAELVSVRKRRYPIQMAYPYSLVDTILLAVPTGYQSRLLPDSAYISDRFGEIMLNYSLEGDQIRITRLKTLNSYQIVPADFAEYDEHRARFTKAINQSLIFERK